MLRVWCALMAEKIRHNYVEDVEWFKDGGMEAAEIAVRLGKKPGTLARALYREGRPDLAAPFNALSWASRQRQPDAKLCAPCRLSIHQAHRRLRDSHHLCKCGFCKTVTDNARGQ
jgi:IS30 family transposase